MSPEIKYYYFPFAGRGESARLTLLMGKIDFEDIRVNPKDFGQFREKTPLGSLPMAEINGKKVVQSTALLRHFGRLTGMYPKDAYKALIVDQIIDTMVDYTSAMVRSGADAESDDKKREARLSAFEQATKRYFAGAQRMVEECETEGDGPFIFGDKATIADVAIASIFMFFKTGYLEHVPVNGLGEYTRMKQIFDGIIANEDVKKYLEKHPLPNMDA